jgi:hypothetical protein
VCFTGAHLGLTIVATLFAAALLALCSLFTLLFYDSHPLTSDLAGKAHGRAEFGMLLIRSLLVIGVQTAGPYIGPWPVIAMLIAGGGAWLGVYGYFMPFTHHGMNAAQLAVGSLFSFAALCLVAGEAYPSFDAAVALYLGAPFALACGVLLANTRRSQLVRLSVFKSSSPYEVELHARYRIQRELRSAMRQKRAELTDGQAVMGGGGGEGGSPSRRPSTRGAATNRGGGLTSLFSTRGGAGGGGGGADAQGSGDDKAHAMFAIAYKQMDCEARAKVARDLLSPSFLAELEEHYRNAVFLFPNSAILQVGACV